MKNIFDDTLIKEYPRLEAKDTFEFSCHPGVECFNKCCNDVNIFLTPYDIIRLKNRLGISSGEFLEKYTMIPIDENLRHPIVMLRMNEETLNCHFVRENGCSVYEDRPWSCRMYPIGAATPKDIPDESGEEFYFLLRESVCKGFENGKKWSVSDWIENQGVKDYNVLGELFKQISLHDFFIKAKAIEPVKMEMFYMVCYDIDRFREFVFGSSFLRRFDVDKKLVEKMREDDSELLKFGFDWLRYSMFGEKTMKVKDEYMQPVK
jgi:uncharacterized protein